MGYHLTPDLMLHLGYAIEAVQVEPGRTSSLGGPDIELFGRFKNGLTSSLRLTLTWDQRDNRLFPTSGNCQTASVDYSPDWLGASFEFCPRDGPVFTCVNAGPISPRGPASRLNLGTFCRSHV